MHKKLNYLQNNLRAYRYASKKVDIFELLTAYTLYVQPRRAWNFFFHSISRFHIPDNIQVTHTTTKFCVFTRKNSLYVVCCMKHIPGVSSP
jgi:hypothetical protein